MTTEFENMEGRLVILAGGIGSRMKKPLEVNNIENKKLV